MSPLLSGLASVASLVFNAASGSSAKAAGGRRASSSEAGEGLPSAVVTLSPQAEALAGFADKGILVAQARTGGALAGSGALAAGASVSVQDFSEILSRLGADDTQRQRIASGFDANQDGSISRDEFLQGVASTSIQKQGTGFSQAVLQLMDRGGDANGVVDQAEFAALTTAFANAAARRLGSA